MKILLIIFLLQIPLLAIAKNSCETLAKRIEKIDQQRRAGGSARFMAKTAKKRSQLEEQLHTCERDSMVGAEIAVYHPKKHRKTRPAKVKAAKKISAVDNDQLQKLIGTCNFWVDEYNTNPSPDNDNYKNTACRAADEFENTIQHPNQHLEFTQKRRAKDCAKPGNVLDDEVVQCMQGKLLPTWNTNSNE